MKLKIAISCLIIALENYYLHIGFAEFTTPVIDKYKEVAHMEYAIIGLCVLAVIIVALIVKKKHTDLEASTPQSTAVQKSDGEKHLSIPIEMLPTDFLDKNCTLTEITDSKILAHIDQVIPGLLQAGTAVDTAVRTAEAGNEVLYRAILPAGAKLSHSLEMEGAVRGFYHGADGIRGHANWATANATGGVSIAANTAAAAMSVASMVVGQYYMMQINAELGKIGDNISEISNFQNNEFRSRVFALFSNVKNIAEFQDEIIENQELRQSKVIQLNSLEEECTKLLGQANLTLADIAKKTGLDYPAYEKEVQAAQNWRTYQETLLAVLYQIAELRFALHLGTVSREHCNASISTYTAQIENMQDRMDAWHQDAAKCLGINVTDSVRKRTGLDKAVHYVPGLMDNSKNFKAIQGGISEMITRQTSPIICQQDQSDLYAEDAQLISMNGKIYYLQSPKSEA